MSCLPPDNYEGGSTVEIGKDSERGTTERKLLDEQPLKDADEAPDPQIRKEKIDRLAIAAQMAVEATLRVKIESLV